MREDADVRLPGARRVASSRKAKADGVDIPQALADQLRALAA
jgi:LDH2 family malate/lactate/ureidoglycolate dehydrogenase